jgi:hypothetical protein
MLNCPECGKVMGWVGDNDTMDEDVYVTTMGCADCHIEVYKFWGDGLEKEGE